MEICFSARIRFLSVAILLCAGNAWSQVQANFPSSGDSETLQMSGSSSDAPNGLKRHLSTHPSGAVGLFHTYSAQTQAPGPYSFGLFFAGNYYSASDFPASSPKYKISRSDLNFGVSYTPVDWIEAFINIGFLSTNDAPPTNPKYSQSGNIGIGGKAKYEFTSEFSAAFVYYLEKRSAVDNITGSKYALNHNLLAVGTYQPSNKWRYNVNIGTRVDNNVRMTDGRVNNQRQLTIFHAYNGQVVPFALSAEYLFDWAVVDAEYSLDYASSSTAGFMSQPQRITLGGRFFPTKDDALSLQLALDIGVSSDTTIKTVVKEPPLSFWFGASYLFGEKKRHPGGDAQNPSFGEDDFGKELKSKKTKKAKLTTDEPKEEVAPVASTQISKIADEDDKGSRITGYVTNIETGDPISNAKLFLCDDSKQPVVTDTTGRYRSPPLKTGSCEIRIEQPNYKSSTETVQVTGDAEQSFDFGLLQQSKEKGALLIRVKDADGNPTEASISFPENPDLKTIKTNEFGLAKVVVAPGEYSVRATAAKMKTQTHKVSVNPKQNLFVDFALEVGNPDQQSKTKKSTSKIEDAALKKPSTVPSSESLAPLPPVSAPKTIVKLSADKKSINVSQRVQFETGKAVLTKPSAKVLDEVAVFIKKHPEIRKIQIGGHTDNTGGAEANLKVSGERAASVKTYLIKKGINAKILEFKGFGQTKPITSNDTETGRNQNRRVEFKILTIMKSANAPQDPTEPAKNQKITTQPLGKPSN